MLYTTQLIIFSAVYQLDKIEQLRLEFLAALNIAIALSIAYFPEFPHIRIF